MEKVTEQSLVMRCREGDLGAFDILYRKYGTPLVNFLDRMIHDTGLAEDMFQETFIRVLENIERYNPAYRFSTWIYKIATNLCLNELKRQKRETLSAILEMLFKIMLSQTALMLSATFAAMALAGNFTKSRLFIITARRVGVFF